MSLSLHSVMAKTPTEDPYLWLEEVNSKKAIDWVKQKNKVTLDELTQSPKYSEIEKEVRKILLAQDRIPIPQLVNAWIYNFWQDDKNIQGVWRRTSREEYQKESTKWEIVLDLDALSREESETWVWHGASCLPPEENLCLISLSRGGKDASVVREFDIEKKKFVRDGFNLPEAKSSAYWKDQNTIWVATDFGPGTLTTSGYPRQIKHWKRGTPLSQAKLIFEGLETDMLVYGFTHFTPTELVHTVSRLPSFFESETQVWSDSKQSLNKIPFPSDVDFLGSFQGLLLGRLRSEWRLPHVRFPSGSIVAMNSKNLDPKQVELVFKPNQNQSIPHLIFTRNQLFITIDQQVKGKVFSLKRLSKGKWKTTELSFPQDGSIDLISSNSYLTDFVMQYTDFLSPPAFYLASSNSSSGKKSSPVLLKQSPKRFDERQMVSKQYFAKSKDGTLIPYFLVHQKNIKLDSTNPTLLTAYGGFEVSETPYYSGATGKVWLEQGGVYAVANIRGGGEFGPRWHSAALREKRQNAFDDFVAVAQDLISRKVTSPAHLGIEGASNGGLLMGASFTQHPELFQAVVCEVPLLDMLRYHHLLSGASWIGEFGNPDDPQDLKIRESIAKYSPYQNLKQDQKYPQVFFLTSTADDRVHPGHARKMAARMEEFHHPFYYFENIEGGHSGSANLEQKIKNITLKYTYFFKKLFKSP